MKTVVNHEKYGEILYDENVWTGKQTITVNGAELKKEKRRLYVGQGADGVISVRIKGNALVGLKLIVNEVDEIKAIAPPKWYDILLSAFIGAFIIVWGNTYALCKIAPLIGGGIGGGIACGISSINFMIIKFQKDIWVQLTVSLAFFALTFGLCYLGGYIVLTTK